jgi:hypothetical protein
VIKDLRMREPFRKDVLFVSELCVHEHAQGPQSCGCRGLVKNFSKSSIAKESGAVDYSRATDDGGGG